MIKYLTIVFLLTIITFQLKAQDDLSNTLLKKGQKTSYTELKMGDYLPNDIKCKMFQFNTDSINLKSFKGKLIIIDFWNTYCSGCVAALPRYDSLQKKFMNDVFILPVTYQSRESVSNLFSRRVAAGKEINICTVVEDTTIRQLFPHDGDPYEVWINKEEKVIKITDPTAVNEGNIRKVLSNLPINTFRRPAYHYVTNTNLQYDSTFLYRSVITKYADSLRNSNYLEAYKKLIHISVCNHTIIEMYKFLYSNLYPSEAMWLNKDYLDKRAFFYLLDSTKMMDRFNSTKLSGYNFVRSHLYCYDLLLSNRFTKLQALNMMKQDLDRYFGVNSSIQKKHCRIFKLICTSKRKLSNYMPPNNSNTEFVKNDEGHIISNNKHQIILLDQNVPYLINILNMNYQIPYIIDATNVTHQLNIRLNFKSLKVNDIKKALKKYNLELIPISKYQSVLILTGQPKFINRDHIN